MCMYIYNIIIILIIIIHFSRIVDGVVLIVVSVAVIDFVIIALFGYCGKLKKKMKN